MTRDFHKGFSQGIFTSERHGCDNYAQIGMGLDFLLSYKGMMKCGCFNTGRKIKRIECSLFHNIGKMVAFRGISDAIWSCELLMFGS